MNSNPVIPHYFGSKNVNGLYQFIINHIPPHTNYIEGFLGSGKILLTKKPAPGLNIGIDKAAAVIDKFNYYYRHHGWPSQMGISMTAVPGSSQIKTTMGPGYHFKFVNGDFMKHFPKLISAMDPIDTFVYLDPPYIPETCSSKQAYRYKMQTRDHIELLDYVTGLSCKVMVSAYKNPVYDSILKGWQQRSIESITRAGMKTETIYLNYGLLSLHDTSLVGKDFTDRQRIKRKIARNISKIVKLPAQEQQAFLEAIHKKFFSNAY